MEVGMSVGLLILRLVVGLSLAAHGAQKLFGRFGGYGLAGTGQFLEQLGFRPGRVFAAQAGLAEVLGGAALALAFTGPGAISADQALGISWSGATWGLAALAAGLIGGAVPLITRKTTTAAPAAQNAA
jgi:putative oxidoreductase